MEDSFIGGVTEGKDIVMIDNKRAIDLEQCKDLHDPKKLTDKYVEAWTNFDVSIKDLP